jgi:hypothetical protein
MRHKHIKLREDSLLARAAAWKLGVSAVALTMGNTIHLYRTRKEDFLGNTRWMKHELAHVEQFRRYGFFRFLTLYLLESMRKGYYNNRFEVEAREAENR